MKPFLGIDLTDDKKNEQFNGNEFLVQKPSAALAKSLEDSTNQAEAVVEGSKLPLPLRIVQTLCGFLALVVLGGILRADVSFEEGYRNAPWLHWLGAVCAVVWLILWLCSRRKAKNVLNTDESEQTFSRVEGVSDAIYQELAVPADAKEMDVLSFYYKRKDGDIKVCEKGMQMAPYLNPVLKIYADAERLYLADLEGKYAFPRSEITAIRTVKKHIRIVGWNKEIGFDKGIYKQYKLTSDNYGCIHCKSYHILELNHNGEAWGIYFPSYELPTVEAVTGLKA